LQKRKEALAPPFGKTWDGFKKRYPDTDFKKKDFRGKAIASFIKKLSLLPYNPRFE
jgi:hypothetical protein